MCKKSVLSTCVIIAAALLLGPSAWGFNANTDPSLMGWWALNDGAGLTAIDGSGNGNDGTLEGDPEWVTGVLGGALEFDGDDYVDTGNTENLTEYTLAIWVMSPDAPDGDEPSGPLHRENNYQINWDHFDSNYQGAAGMNAGGWMSLKFGTLEADTWYHLAVTFDGTNWITYQDGEQMNSRVVNAAIANETNSLKLGRHAANAAQFFTGTVDDARVYRRALTADEIKVVMGGGIDPGAASNPNPADEDGDVCRDVILGWTSGQYADTHDVYFGTVFEDVNDASRDNDPRGLLVSPGQRGNSYDPFGLLDFDQTYYWRVDEFDGTETHTGDVWSFTTEPMGYPIPGENIIATASSFNTEDTEQGPEQTVNGSGLEGDLHSRNIEDMWLSEAGAEGPAWIKYEFDKVFKLHEMLVWNYNGPISLRFSGLQDVTVKYSVDDVNWVTIPDVNEFAQAPGSNDYAANTIVPFGGVSVKYVEITANSNFSGGIFDQYGLSEVRFLYIPSRARLPVPASGEADVALDAVLSWRAGREAGTHDIYISTSEQEVADATVATESISGDSCEIVYVPSSLDLGQRYYWKVVEVDPDSTVWEGDIWNFSTIQNFVVDDFESYTDFSPNEVFNTWIDGYEDAANGSTAGYPNPDFVDGEHYLEDVNVHGGDWSMPLFYDNSSARISEVTRTFTSTMRDWTQEDVVVLTLFYYGDPNNTPEQMYVALDGDAVVNNDDPDAALAEDWTRWDIPLQIFEDMGVNLGDVDSMTIGFGNKSNPTVGGAGHVFVDDIWLFTPLPDLE